MSEENVEIVRESWDAWFRGDMDSLLSYYDAEIVWDMTHFREWPDNTYRGHEGVRRFLDECSRSGMTSKRASRRSARHNKAAS